MNNYLVNLYTILAANTSFGGIKARSFSTDDNSILLSGTGSELMALLAGIRANNIEVHAELVGSCEYKVFISE